MLLYVIYQGWPDTPHFTIVNRTLFERLFTLPWKPFAKQKMVYKPLVYHYADGTKLIRYKKSETIDGPLKPKN